MSDYRTKSLGELANLRRGITYVEKDLRDNPDDGLPYVNMKSFLKDSGFNKHGLKYYSGPFTQADVAHEKSLLIANTDVTRDGDIIGVPALLPEKIRSDTVLFSHHVTRLSLPDEITSD